VSKKSSRSALTAIEDEKHQKQLKQADELWNVIAEARSFSEQRRFGGPTRATKGYAQSSCKKLQVRQERCPEIASFRVFGHMINPTVFFVHDFDRFYRFKMAHLSIDGKGMIFVQHGYTTSTSLSSICFCCYSL
jgi:hypothetical protein